MTNPRGLIYVRVYVDGRAAQFLCGSRGQGGLRRNLESGCKPFYGCIWLNIKLVKKALASDQFGHKEH